MVSASTTASSSARLVYELKASPYSSHSVLLSLLPASGEGKTVLDIGCGNGYIGALLAERGYRVTGVERRGGYAEDFPSSVELMEADLEQGLPSLPQKYDFVICADVLEHLRDPASMLRQIQATLRPNGRLIVSLPNSGNIYFRLNILFGRFPQDDKGLFDRTHLHFYMWKGWEDLFRSTGYTFVDVRLTAIPIGLTVPKKWESSPVVRACEAGCLLLAKLRKSLFSYQFVISARVGTNAR